jgi:hypothetical protein
MTDHVYKTIELCGSSAQGLQHAIEQPVVKGRRDGAGHALVPDDGSPRPHWTSERSNTDRWG